MQFPFVSYTPIKWKTRGYEDPQVDTIVGVGEQMEANALEVRVGKREVV
jgi:hypothetical protein